VSKVEAASSCLAVKHVDLFAKASKTVEIAEQPNRTGKLVKDRSEDSKEAFFRSARSVTSSVPERITGDGHDSYPGAIKAELGEAVRHRTNRYLNNHLEQDHRGIKQRTRPMGGSRLSSRCDVFAESMTKCGTFSGCALGGTRASRSRNGDCSTRPVRASS